MCINPNICIPNGHHPSGRVKYDVLRSARSHIESISRPDGPFYNRYSDFQTEKVLRDFPEAFLAPCQICTECRLKEANMKAIRVIHEMQSFTHSIFLTLTYNDNNLVYNDGAIRPTLRVKHVQDFIKRLRRFLDYRGKGKIRYLYAGEYGTRSLRPHYHLIIFGYFPDDARYLPQCSSATVKCFTSPTLERLWPYGFNCFGSVNFHSARYVAQYSLKKQTGVHASFYDDNKISSEFVHLSNQPGIGFDFFRNHYKSIINNGFIVVEGVKYGIPRYYIDKLEELDPQLYDTFTSKRLANAKAMLHDFERDFAREQILNHKTEQFRYSYDNSLLKLESLKKV